MNVVLFDGDCGFCDAVARRLATRSLAWRPWQGEASLPPGVDAARLEDALALVTPRGDVHWGFHAFRRIAWRIWWLAPLAVLAWLPGAAWLGTRAYAAVAARRRDISMRLGMNACAVRPRDRSSGARGNGAGRAGARDQMHVRRRLKMKKTLITGLAIASLTTAAIGTSFAERMTGRAVDIGDLSSVEPVTIQIEDSPGQGILPLAAAVGAGMVVGAAVSWAVSEYYHHHGGNFTSQTPTNLGERVFDVGGR